MQSGSRALLLGLPILALVGLNFVGSWPNTMAFERFAFGDFGWPLAVDEMLDHGLTPTRDFGYYYGLLTLVIDRGVFAAFGRTPLAVGGLYAVCNLLIAVGLIRFGLNLGVAGVSRLFLIAAAPLAVMPAFFPSTAHALEAALLMNALASQAGGRNDRALLLTVLAVLVKPALGYVYGLLLVIHILAAPGSRSRLAQLLPAAVVGVVLVAALVAKFGWEPVWQTQFPLSAAGVYQEKNFGFFRDGRQFWMPDNNGVMKYVLSPAGVWIAGTVFLWLAALALLPRYRERGACVAVTCAVLHAAFVFAFFGNWMSWIYYSYLLVGGVTAAITAFTRAPGGEDVPETEGEPGPLAWVGVVAGVALVVMLLPGYYLTTALSDLKLWAERKPHPATAGLTAPPHVAAEWDEVRAKGRGGKVLVLSQFGCSHLLAPEVDAVRAWVLLRASATPAELARVNDQLRAADWVVVPVGNGNDLDTWPEFADSFKRFEKVNVRKEGSLFTYYRRPPG